MARALDTQSHTRSTSRCAIKLGARARSIRCTKRCYSCLWDPRPRHPRLTSRAIWCEYHVANNCRGGPPSQAGGSTGGPATGHGREHRPAYPHKKIFQRSMKSDAPAVSRDTDCIDCGEGGGVPDHLSPFRRRHDPPGAEQLANWLPAPKEGAFRLVMRLYRTEEAGERGRMGAASD